MTVFPALNEAPATEVSEGFQSSPSGASLSALESAGGFEGAAVPSPPAVSSAVTAEKGPAWEHDGTSAAGPTVVSALAFLGGK